MFINIFKELNLNLILSLLVNPQQKKTHIISQVFFCRTVLKAKRKVVVQVLGACKLYLEAAFYDPLSSRAPL